MDEWYKAAYYDPNKNGGVGGYWDYATGSDTAPAAVANGTADNTAVYGGQAGPADITLAGGLSPYGIMGLGGNVYEWEETAYSLNKSSVLSARGIRGGNWDLNSSVLSSSTRNNNDPALKINVFGFRVASPFMEQCQRSSLFGPESKRLHFAASPTVPSQGLPDSPAHRASCRWANNRCFSLKRLQCKQHMRACHELESDSVCACFRQNTIDIRTPFHAWFW